MTATAAWPTRDLVGALARSGWGPLDGRPMGGARAVLRALVDLLPYGSGEGSVTVPQVADLAGLSAKWARRCLRVLADLGIITHQVGSVRHGVPTPGHARINKRALAALLPHAARRLTARRADRKGATTARLAAHGVRDWWPKRADPRAPRPGQNPLSFQVELTSTLTTPRGGTHHGAGSTRPGSPREEQTMIHGCVHGLPDITTCALCRRTLADNPRMDVRKLWRDQPDAPVVVPRGGWRAMVAAAAARDAAAAASTDDGQEALL